VQVADGIAPWNVAISQASLKGDKVGFGQVRAGNRYDDLIAQELSDFFD
jgi:hypothetical protein